MPTVYYYLHVYGAVEFSQYGPFATASEIYDAAIEVWREFGHRASDTPIAITFTAGVMTTEVISSVTLGDEVDDGDEGEDDDDDDVSVANE